ncbi:MAG: hypothetical protein KAI57_00340 [Candidatus Pacebacteria bacterium]|nr:hypothetical protein [Candidatus Paceibacterota bacterium]
MNEILKDVLDAMTSLAIIFGVLFSYLQIKKISKTIDINKKSNFIKVLGRFTKEYDSLMIEIGDCNSQKKVDVWYFRLWNLYTNEFVFFYQGILDPLIFEFWAFRLCLFYNEKPSDACLKRTPCYKKSHLKYMKNREKSYPRTDAFYHELIKIADEEKNEENIENRVHKLVQKYRKSK